MEPAEKSDSYTVPEAARVLGVNHSTVWRWVEAGRLPAQRVGVRGIRIRKADLAAVIGPAQQRSREETPAAAPSALPVPPPEAAAAPAPPPQGPAALQPLADEEIARALAALDQAARLREAILARRHGEPLSPSWLLIRPPREERAEGR